MNITLLGRALLAAVLLSGCAGAPVEMAETVKVSLLGQPDTNLDSSQIQKIPYASAYLKVGDLPRAFVVLAYAERGELKWMSRDRNLFVTRAGRLIKTLGQGSDIVYSGSQADDPLALGLHKSTTPLSWDRTVEWSDDYRSGHQLHSRFVPHGRERIAIMDREWLLLHFSERVTDVTLGKKFTNEYWIDPQTGLVRKSRQYLGPDMPVIEFTLLKPFTS